jgi:hypothetical protein
MLFSAVLTSAIRRSMTPRACRSGPRRIRLLAFVSGALLTACSPGPDQPPNVWVTVVRPTPWSSASRRSPR